MVFATGFRGQHCPISTPKVLTLSTNTIQLPSDIAQGLLFPIGYLQGLT